MEVELSTVDDFVDALVQSRLLEEEQAKRLLTEAPDPALKSIPQFGSFLMERAVITHFQYEKFQKGAVSGLFLGPFLLLCPIARGGMGVVYLARHLMSKFNSGTSRLQALKLLPPKRAKAEPRTLARFRREMDIGLALPNHPFITKTLDAGTADGIHFLALEYVPGYTAKQLCDRKELSISQSARVFADVATGLTVIHKAGYVHRDLKPSNIVVLPSGRGKLIDFGFTIKLGEKLPDDPSIVGGPGYTLGTMDYIAPEQAENAIKVTASADIYSLGCSLYYVLTGQAPFQADTAKEKLALHKSERAESMRELNPNVPKELRQLVSKMMAKKPEDRPASCEEVAKSLERFVESSTKSVAVKFDATWESAIVRDVEDRWQTHRLGLQDADTSSEQLSLERQKEEEDPLEFVADKPRKVKSESKSDSRSKVTKKEETTSSFREKYEPIWDKHRIPIIMGAVFVLVLGFCSLSSCLIGSAWFGR